MSGHGRDSREGRPSTAPRPICYVKSGQGLMVGSLLLTWEQVYDLKSMLAYIELCTECRQPIGENEAGAMGIHKECYRLMFEKEKANG